MAFGVDTRALWISYILLGSNLFSCCGFQLHHRPTRANSFSLSVLTEGAEALSDDCTMNDDICSRKFLIHWRGEKDVGYSKPFRRLEFRNALAAELEAQIASTSDSIDGPEPIIEFKNALNYTGNETMTDMNIEHFNEGMQFVSFSSKDSNAPGITKETIIRAVERCSLIHALYEIAASSDSLDDLAELAIQDGCFSDMYKGGANEKATWCFRARLYSASELPESTSVKGRGKRYSSRTRSMKIERDGLKALTDLLIQFGGKVNLEDPDCKVYIFDGLEDEINGTLVPQKFLARRIAAGPRVCTNVFFFVYKIFNMTILTSFCRLLQLLQQNEFVLPTLRWNPLRHMFSITLQG